MNIKLWDLFENLIIYILLSTFQIVHMMLTVKQTLCKKIYCMDSQLIETLVSQDIQTSRACYFVIALTVQTL